MDGDGRRAPGRALAPNLASGGGNPVRWRTWSMVWITCRWRAWSSLGPMRVSMSAPGAFRYAVVMPILSLAVMVMTAALLALLLLLLRLTSQPSLPRLAGELVTVALLASALGWGVLTMAQRLPQ